MSSQEFHGIRADSAVDALGIAAANGLHEEIQALLEEGVDINGVATYSGNTPLASAAGQGRHRTVALLLEAGADLDRTGANDLTPLMHACSCGGARGSKVALQLIAAGADVSAVRESDEMTALKFAVGNCKPEVIQALVDHGAGVDGPAGTSQTALMLAARANDVPALKILVDGGADRSLPCRLPWAENRTALGLAELEKRRKATDYLRSLE